MEKHLCSVLALLLFLDFLDSLTLTVPEEVTGLLRKSVAIPCIFKPSAQYTNLEVTWYIDRYTIVIQRDKLGDYIPLFKDQNRVSINESPGDVSLVLKNLAYGDRGTYTCEVKLFFINGIMEKRKSSGVNLIVVRALPSTKPTTSLISNPISEFTNRKIPVWVFVLTIVSIVLFFSATILFILYRSKTERDHKYEFTRTERFSLQEPVNLNSNENNEYEIMSKLDQLSIQNYKWDLPVDKHMLQFEEE
ncbi:V-set and immunoglobulin domain-containing protein 4-like isoform X2 [Narcine bancroftii]|uniref:V-set and immunoglobulin domain-containing protein 4-like isoform X2 n=1 Tax=Narcine bancroftii TaxID=1343680 RepID=UPI0038322336